MAPEDSGEDGAPEPDDTPNHPPPDPLDRPWVHPSELRSFVSTPPPTTETQPRAWAIGIGSAVAAVTVTLLVLVAFGALGGRHRAALPPPVVTSPNDVIDYAVAERVGTAVAPTVVMVRAATGAGTAMRAVGSGVIVSSDRVVTTAHTLTGATEVAVVTDTLDQLTAKVVGIDPQTDVAVLSITGEGLQLANVAAGAPPRVGQPVVAVAARRGGHPTVSIDVVSDRNAMVDAGTGVEVAGLLETGIRVDADMSGAALFDANGNLVAILTRATTGTPDGLAIPVAMVRDVQDQLDGSGKVAHGWIGVVCDGQPADLPDGESGARLQVVFDASPAKDGGLEAGDVVIRAGGRAVDGRADLVAAVRGLRPQDRLELTYLRGGSRHTANLTLGAGDPQLLGQWPAMG